jgi:hypothetical protein
MTALTWMVWWPLPWADGGAEQPLHAIAGVLV